MKKNTVSVYNPFKLTQLTAIGEYLAEKEAEGLRLIAYTKGKFTFQKAPEKKARYSVVIFRSVQRDEFLASCEEKGWEFVSSDRDVYVFRTENPAAEKIRTDERIALKATLGTLGGPCALLGLVLLHFVRIVVFRTAYEAPIETKYAQLTGLVIVLCFAIQSLREIIHYTLWRIRAEKAVKSGKEIPFYNFKQAKRIQLFDDASGIILMVLWFIAFCVFSLGYSPEIWHFWLEGGIASLYILVILTGRIIFERKSTIIKIIALCVLTIAMAAGIFGVTQLSLSKYESYSREFLSFEGNPVSVTDFGIAEENAEEKEPIENISCFAEHYIFRSSTKKENEDGTKPYVYYDVLKSEHERIVRKYEKQIRERMERYNSEIKQLEDTKGWDALYMEVHEGKHLDSGYAIKGNTIIYLDVCSDVTFDEFFEKANEKLN